MTDAVDIVVPTFRGAERLADCLERLGAPGPQSHLWLVDDASGDGTAERLREAYPEATVIARSVNGGFARSADEGLRAGSAPYVALLNDDLLPEPGFLDALVEPLRADPQVGLVAAVLLRPGGDDLEGVGIEADPTVAGYSRHWGARRGDVAALDHRGLLGPSGGAAAYRRAALEQVGFLDTGIGSYSEDLDLALRLRAAGWQARAATGAVAVHLGSAAFGRRSARQLHAKGYSRGYLLRKYGVLTRPSSAVPALVGEAATIARQLVRDRSAAGLRGRVAGWRAATGDRETVPSDLLNRDIGVLEAVRRRRAYGG